MSSKVNKSIIISILDVSLLNWFGQDSQALKAW